MCTATGLIINAHAEQTYEMLKLHRGSENLGILDAPVWTMAEGTSGCLYCQGRFTHWHQRE